MADTPETLTYVAVDDTLKCMGLPALEPAERDEAAKMLLPVRPQLLDLYSREVLSIFARQAPQPLTPVEIEQAVKSAVIACFGGMMSAMMHQAEIMRSPDIAAFTAAGMFFKNYFMQHQNKVAAAAAAPVTPDPGRIA